MVATIVLFEGRIHSLFLFDRSDGWNEMDELLIVVSYSTMGPSCHCGALLSSSVAPLLLPRVCNVRLSTACSSVSEPRLAPVLALRHRSRSAR